MVYNDKFYTLNYNTIIWIDVKKYPRKKTTKWKILNNYLDYTTELFLGLKIPKHVISIDNATKTLFKIQAYSQITAVKFIEANFLLYGKKMVGFIY